MSFLSLHDSMVACLRSLPSAQPFKGGKAFLTNYTRKFKQWKGPLVAVNTLICTPFAEFATATSG
jgi:hypothetical protein